MNIISIIIAIILFSIIVIFHELGHFWLAKANGIKVNEFCLGLGPKMCIRDSVKATFFVTADTSGKYDDVYKRIVQDGHTIAMASYSNSYSKIYESTEAFTRCV